MSFWKRKTPDTGAVCTGKYLGYDLFELCPCGATVKPYERQRITFYEEKECWLRLCAKCLNKKEPEPITATPEQLESTELILVPQG